MQGVGWSCVLTGGCAFGAQRLCLRGPETFFASRLAACKAPRGCAQRRRSAAAPRAPTPTRSVCPGCPPRPALSPPLPLRMPRPPPPPPRHNCVGRRRGCLVGWRTAASVLASPATAWRDSPPSFALPWDGLAWCLAPVTAQISESRLNDAPPSVRALSRAQPKWEQAVRRVLRKDEHVVFAVIGGWVRAALCKKVGSRNLTVPEFTGASRSLRSLRVLHAFG